MAFLLQLLFRHTRTVYRTGPGYRGTRIGLPSSFIVDYYSTTSSFPASLTNIETTTSGKYVGSLAITSGGSNATLTATMGSTEVNPDVQNNTFIIISNDGGLHWLCNNGNLLTRHLPGVRT